MVNIKNIDKTTAKCNLPKGYDINYQGDDPSCIFVRSSNLHNYTFNNSLLSVSRLGAGTDNIPIDELTNKGVAVFSTPSCNSNAVKELVLYYLLAYSRNAFELASVRDTKFISNEVAGKTISIIGLGQIGFQVALACTALGMKVKGYDNNKLKQHYPGNFVVYNSLEECIKNSDFVSIHIPSTEENKKIISADIIKLMSSRTVLINTSRRDIVDETAVEKALDSNKLKAYIADFPCDIISDKYIYTSHIGASTYEAEQRCMNTACSDIKNYIETGATNNCLNLPNIMHSKTKEHRATIICKPNVVFTDEIVSGTKNNIKYCILDSNKPFKYYNNPNIIKMRILY